MNMLRRWAAEALYAAGAFIEKLCDDWLRIGLRGPIYSVYNWLMLRSADLQGDGPGPWEKP